jgi:hypothetical protein
MLEVGLNHHHKLVKAFICDKPWHSQHVWQMHPDKSQQN